MKPGYDRQIARNIKVHDRLSRKYEARHGEIFNDIEQSRLAGLLTRARDAVRTSNAKLRALDFGCGSGNLTRHLRDVGLEVTAADVSQGFLHLVKSRYPDVRTVLMNGRDLSNLDSDTFDLVATYSVLHHIPDYLAAIREMARVTRVGGVIVIDHEPTEAYWLGDPTYAEFRKKALRPDWSKYLGPMNYVHRLRRVFEPRYANEGDIHVWPDDHVEWGQIKRLLAEIGFDVVLDEDYLLYQKLYRPAVYEQYVGKCTDTKVMAFRKRVAQPVGENHEQAASADETAFSTESRPFKGNKFSNIPDSMVDAYLAFAERNPERVTKAQVLEKLIIFDSMVPELESASARPRILEIGCGSGLHSTMLSKFGAVSATELKSTVSWLGNSIGENRETIFRELGTGEIDFRYNDGRSMPFEDASFDVVVHNSVIEHVPDPVAFNRETSRILKPRGICICVTGTPALCRFRYLKNYLVRLPLILGYGIIVLSFDRLFSRTDLARKLYGRVSWWHFQPTRKRLQSIIDEHYGGGDEASSVPEAALRKQYPSLRHFIREPEYNRIVIERMAQRFEVSPRSLLLQLSEHFKSTWNDLLFRTVPSTHSQHTQNFRTEMRDWKIAKWVRSFTDAGFQVEEVRGYRFQQAVELTFSDRANAWIAYQALPLTRAAARLLKPHFASEIIIRARRLG